MITTNGPEAAVKTERKKLNIITTAIIPNREKLVDPAPQPKATDRSKMITTNDLDDAGAKVKKGERSKKAE